MFTSLSLVILDYMYANDIANIYILTILTPNRWATSNNLKLSIFLSFLVDFNKNTSKFVLKFIFNK